jgi:hypothetical protein
MGLLRSVKKKAFMLGIKASIFSVEEPCGFMVSIPVAEETGCRF